MAKDRAKDTRRQFKDVGSLQRMGEALGWKRGKDNMFSMGPGNSPTPTLLRHLEPGKGHVKNPKDDYDPSPYYQASVTTGFGA